MRAGRCVTCQRVAAMRSHLHRWPVLMGDEEDVSKLSSAAIALTIEPAKILEALAHPAEFGSNDPVFGGMAALTHHDA